MSTNATAPSTELVAAPPLVPMSPEQARRAMADFQAFTAAMLDPDTDWQRSSGIAPFVKRSGWRKIATGYTLSCEILDEEVVERDPETGEPKRARARARVYHHESGRSWEGTGRCSTTEKRFRRGDLKAEHDVTATAVTRAINRATSDLVGFGQVSAEEVDGGAAVAPPVLDNAGLRDLAQALEARWPASDSFRFLNALIKRLDGGVPESVGVALRAWARFATDGPGAGPEAPQAGSQGPQTTESSTTPGG